MMLDELNVLPQFTRIFARVTYLAVRPVSQAHQAAIVKAFVRVENLVGPLSHRLTGASIQGFSPNRLLRPAL